jgi:alkanesulfonate monooxygenase SsuD/methylene tetrahydromethanopterin reductase-like flavin-dependent oxidoreductase (luciferase family)
MARGTAIELGAALEGGLPVAATARRAEELGFDLVAIGEHVSFHIPASNPFVALAVAAGSTSSIRLLSSVTLLPLYPAALAAKLAAELAHHSAGRFHLGVGIGGEFPPEFEACGVPLAERAARADEALVVLGRLLREERVTFRGRFTRLTNFGLSPRPEHPPAIWIGGRRESAWARAARFADVWMPYLYMPDQLAESLGTIRAAARDRHGRDPRSIGAAVYAWTCLDEHREAALERATAVLSANYARDMRSAAERYVIAGNAADCAAGAREYLAAGAERVIFAPIAESPAGRLEALEQIGRNVLPELRAAANARANGVGASP